MFSRAFRNLKTAASWGHTPITFLISSRFFVTSKPPMTAVPFVGLSIPLRMLIVVVFPAPFGPRRLKSSPCLISRFKLSTAVTSSNFFTRSFTIIVETSLDSIFFSRGFFSMFRISCVDTFRARSSTTSALDQVVGILIFFNLAM